MGAAFVARTLLKNLLQDEVPLPALERWEGGPTTFPLKKLGISHPVLIPLKNVQWSNQIEVDDVEEAEKPGEGDGKKNDEKSKPAAKTPNRNPLGGAAIGVGGDRPKKKIDAPRYDFVVQFCWQAPPPQTMVELTQIYPGAAAANAAAVAAGPVAPDEEAVDDARGAPGEPTAEGDVMDGDEPEQDAGDSGPAETDAADAAGGNANGRKTNEEK